MQPLYEAVRSGDRERVKSLVAADPPLVPSSKRCLPAPGRC